MQLYVWSARGYSSRSFAVMAEDEATARAKVQEEIERNTKGITPHALCGIDEDSTEGWGSADEAAHYTMTVYEPGEVLDWSEA